MSKTLDETTKLIEELDLEPIIFKLVKSKGWTLSEARQGVKEYKRFLFLIAKYGAENQPKSLKGLLAPFNDAMDEVWHTHILDTAKYIEDCQNIFGRYIHHYPYSGMFEGENILNQRERSKALRGIYEKEFRGIPSAILMGPETQPKLECEQCDSCNPGECGASCVSGEGKTVRRERPTVAMLSV